MIELTQILDALGRIEPDAKPVLATVVDVKGSSFRLPGAKMLILEDGTAVGTVSGGCLEADVLARAKQVRETGEAQFVDYDTNDENSVFSLNMGCRGIVRILMEPAVDNAKLDFLRETVDKSKSGVIATRIDAESTGEFLIHEGENSEGALESSIVEQICREVFLAQKSRHAITDRGEVFFEFIQPATRLFIFGASTEAVPLASFASDLGWKVVVIDHRPAYATGERFPGAESVIVNEKESLLAGIEFSNGSVAVVMTHNVETDKQVLSRLLTEDLAYIGQMGPKSRTNDLILSVRENGVDISEETLGNLHGPVGLDIGATTPEGIALSIVAEIQAVLGERNGGHLKERVGSIYGRTEEAE